MSAEPLSEEQIIEYKDAFEHFDSDSDGYCTFEELEEVFHQIGQEYTDDEINRMIAEFDTPNTRKPNTLEFPEFLYFIGKRVQDDQEDTDLREAFAFFDKNKDGRISVDELRTVMRDSLSNMYSGTLS